MIDLTGQHLFVAGGGRGIGRATAQLAARAGAFVSINYRRDQRAAETVAGEIRDAGGKAFAVQADISEEGAAKAAILSAVENARSLDGACRRCGYL